MKSTTVTVLVAAIVGWLASYLAQSDFGPFAGDKKVSNAVILFYGSSGACRAKVFPDPITAEKKYRLHWTIADTCGLPADATITLTWEAIAGNGETGADPIETIEIDPNKKYIKGNLKESVEAGNRFRYRVLLNGDVVTDPDVEIVQF
jgi:hypothetical protein